MIKLASIIAVSSVLALMASGPPQSTNQQTNDPAPAHEAVADQAPLLSEAMLSLPGAAETKNRALGDPGLARDVLRDPLGRRHRGGPMGELTPELIKQCLEVAHDVKPQLAARLERLKRDSTAPQFEQAMRRNARHLLNLVRLRDRDPGLYDLKMRELQTGEEIQQVTVQLREALGTGSMGQAQLFKAELRELVRLQASQSIEARGRYLMRIQEHMTALSQQIDEEATNFDSTVERRFQEIIEPIEARSTTLAVPTSG